MIWGIIGYKIISGINSEEPEVTEQNMVTTFNPKKAIKADMFSISKVERDPFLGTLERTKTKKTTGKSLKSKPKLLQNLPSITYGGLIKKKSSTEQIFVVNINNQQYLLKKGQVADSVKLLRGDLKEIVVRYKSKSQTIKLQ